MSVSTSSTRQHTAATLIVAGILTVGACADDNVGPTATEPSSTTTSMSVTGSASPADSVGAAQLATLLGCTNLGGRDGDPNEPARPVEALQCTMGEARLGIDVYATADDRDTVLDYLQQFTGFRVSGGTWLIAVDTPEAATEAARLTGGELIELSGNVDR